MNTPTLSLFPILPLARSLAGNDIGAEGATELAAILNETNITNLKCAAAPECILKCQRPVSLSSWICIILPRSVSDNCIGDQGATALAAILNKTNITYLKCAAAPECSLPC